MLLIIPGPIEPLITLMLAPFFHPIFIILPHKSTQTNTNKLIPTNRTIPIQIKLLNHSNQFLLLQPFSQFPSHPPQVTQIDGAFSICIE